LRLRQHEAELAFAVDRQDRDLHGADAGDHGHEHERFHARRQLQADPRARLDARRPQRRGHRRRAVAILRERQPAIVLVDRQQRVR
jgi:hypothetical protein